MIPSQEVAKSVTDNGAAIILWLTSGCSVYFLKRFADGIDGMKERLRKVEHNVTRLCVHNGLTEENK